MTLRPSSGNNPKNVGQQPYPAFALDQPFSSDLKVTQNYLDLFWQFQRNFHSLLLQIWAKNINCPILSVPF